VTDAVTGVELFYVWSMLAAMTKLQRLREKRGWTIQETARRAGVSWQSIKNMEDATTERPGDPDKSTVATANALIEVFYPDLRLCDFVRDTNLQVEPASGAAMTRIRDKQT